MLFNDMPFSKPFIVKMHGGLEHKFLNAYDALDFLENEWPVRTGPFYEAAMRACCETLSGTGSILAARVALMAACFEAGFEPLCDGDESSLAATRTA